MGWTTIQTSIASLLTQEGLAVSFYWGGSEFSGVRSQLKREAVASDRGLEGQYDFSLLCPTAQFGGVLPQPRRDKILIEGREYRILSIDEDALSAAIKLNLGRVTQ